MNSEQPTAASGPRWQLESIFTGTDSDSFRSATDSVSRSLDEISEHLDSVESGGGAATSAAAAELAERLLRLTDAAHTGLVDVSGYLYCRIATDSFDEAAHAELSLIQPLRTRATILASRATRLLASLDLKDTRSDYLARHRYTLQRTSARAAHLLAPEAEEIVASIAPNGAAAFARLHGALASRETIRVALKGGEEAEYSLAQLGTFAADPDRTVREAAYRAELELAGRNQTAFTQAMNAIKGEVGELARRRGFGSALDEELFGSDLSPGALSAMQEACREHFPLMRRFLKAKAGLLGRERLAWFDLRAPISAEPDRQYSWDEARDFIITNFRAYSEELAAFAARAFDENWIDAPPGKGKATGAFCIGIPGRRESRILMNFGGSLEDLFTIAHELGHAWHNELVYRSGRTSHQRQTPMTLAETASIFCETLIFQAVFGAASETGKLAILDHDLTHAGQLLLDIHSRFLFEQGVFTKRAERELSEREMLELMLAAQEETYGDGLDSDVRHPLMWATKSHYYSADISYYNFPYTFGYLFGLGLYSEFERAPDGFEERYNALLSSTGMAGSFELAAQFGIDLEDGAFWRRSLSILEDRVLEYEHLAAARQGS